MVEDGRFIRIAGPFKTPRHPGAVMVKLKDFPAVNGLICQIITMLMGKPPPRCPFEGIDERPARDHFYTKVKFLSVI